MASNDGIGLSSNMVHPTAAVTKLAWTLHKVTDTTIHYESFFCQGESRDIVLTCAYSITDHLADEWPLIAILDNFVSAVMTAVLIASGCQAGYFGGPSAVLELVGGLVDFKNNDLPGLFPPSLDRSSNDRNAPLDILVSRLDSSSPTSATNYEASFNRMIRNQPPSE